MPRESFVKEYMEVRHLSFKESTIQAAWRKSGYWPIDQTVFKNEDYAPSILTSTSSLHVPDSFPVSHNAHIQPDFYEYLPDLDEDEPHENDDLISISPRDFNLNDDTQSLQHLLKTRQRQVRRHHNQTSQPRDENAAFRSRIATLEAQCAMACCEIQDLKRCGNVKDSRARKRQKLNIEARCLMSEEGLRLAQEYEAAKEAQEQKKREAWEQQAAKEAEREQLQLERDLNEPFTGALTTKTKPDLQDIAQALGLLYSGGKKDLLEHIVHHFDVNPDLQNSHHYEGLFSQSRQRPVQDENAPNPITGAGAPTPSHLRLVPLLFDICNFQFHNETTQNEQMMQDKRPQTIHNESA